MTSKYIFFILLGVDALILFLQTSQISISYEEAKILYGSFSPLQLLINFSLTLLGNNDIGLRFMMIVIHLMSVVLMYLISYRYIDEERDRLWLLLIFILLPGIVSSAVIVNSAGIIIFGLLLFVYLSEKVAQKYLNIILLLYSIVDIGFAYLFLGLSVYYFFRKKKELFLYMIVLYLITSYLYGFEVSGAPSGHFLDTIGVYSAIFSPIIFIYLFYALYRKYLLSKVDMLWYISSTILTLSLILSFRQRIPLEHFAPYLIIALPIAAQSFISSYRVRLKMFRTPYKMAFIISLVFLVLNTFVVLFNKELYRVIENPKLHFAYEMHVAKELSDKLKKNNIVCLETDVKMQERLLFYGITQCKSIYLSQKKVNDFNKDDVTISYRNRVVYRANVTKINNL